MSFYRSQRLTPHRIERIDYDSECNRILLTTKIGTAITTVDSLWKHLKDQEGTADGILIRRFLSILEERYPEQAGIPVCPCPTCRAIRAEEAKRLDDEDAYDFENPYGTGILWEELH